MPAIKNKDFYKKNTVSHTSFFLILIYIYDFNIYWRKYCLFYKVFLAKHLPHQ